MPNERKNPFKKQQTHTKHNISSQKSPQGILKKKETCDPVSAKYASYLEALVPESIFEMEQNRKPVGSSHSWIWNISHKQ
jgi:hypothetical protein